MTIDPLGALSRWPQYMAYFDPLTVLRALAAMTTHVGLRATATTSYNETYHIARKFASLDRISGGRVGWNVVTSSNVSEAFNSDASGTMSTMPATTGRPRSGPQETEGGCRDQNQERMGIGSKTKLTTM